MTVSEATKTKVDSLIAKEHVFIASKTYCPYCHRAKKLVIGKYNPEGVKILELNEMPDGDEIQEYLLEKTGQRTVPNIFIDGKHIGGCSDVMNLESKGTLKGLL